MKSLLSLVLTVTLLSGCANFASFQKDKPIEIERNGFATVLKQDGEILNPFSVMDGLAADPASADAVRPLKILRPASLALAFGGGWLLGEGLFVPEHATDDDRKTARNNVALGVGVTAAAFALAFYVDRRMGEAAEMYNAAHGGKSTWYPLLNFDGTSPVVGAGLGYAF